MNHKFFPQRPNVTPTIYVYKLIGVTTHEGYLKIGYTDRTAKVRIDEQTRTANLKYEILYTDSAMKSDGSCFTDKDVHNLLERRGFMRLNPEDKPCEWFKCNLNDIKAAIVALQSGNRNIENRTETFGMRPEQYNAVKQDYAAMKNMIYGDYPGFETIIEQLKELEMEVHNL